MEIQDILNKLNAVTARGMKPTGENVYVARDYTIAELRKDLEKVLKEKKCDT